MIKTSILTYFIKDTSLIYDPPQRWFWILAWACVTGFCVSLLAKLLGLELMYNFLDIFFFRQVKLRYCEHFMQIPGKIKDSIIFYCGVSVFFLCIWPWTAASTVHLTFGLLLNIINLLNWLFNDASLWLVQQAIPGLYCEWNLSTPLNNFYECDTVVTALVAAQGM